MLEQKFLNSAAQRAQKILMANLDGTLYSWR